MPSESKIPETLSGSYTEKPRALADLRSGIVSGSIKASDLAAAYFDRIADLNPYLNVYLSLNRDRALAQAARIDEMAAKGDPLRRWPASRWASRMCW